MNYLNKLIYIFILNIYKDILCINLTDNNNSNTLTIKTIFINNLNINNDEFTNLYELYQIKIRQLAKGSLERNKFKSLQFENNLRT